MKKNLFAVAVLASVFGNAAFAQSSPLQLGAEVGLAAASIVGGDSEDSDTRTTPYGGFTLVVHKPNARFGFQTGLLLVPKGASTDLDNGKASFELNYVEIPLLLRISLPLRESNIVPTLLLGGSVGVKNSCKVTGESGSLKQSIDCDDSAFEGDLDVKTVDVGASAGLEVGIPIAKRFMLAPTIRYTRGLTKIVDATDDDQAKNAVFQGGVAFRIRM